MSGDQQWQGYQPGGTAGESSDPPAEPRRPVLPSKPAARPAARTQRATSGRSGISSNARALRALILGGAAVVLVTVVGLSAYLGSEKDGVPGFGKPDALSAEGLDQLRADIRDETGGTEVFRAVIYPEYASVDLPVDDRSQRSQTRYWDGDLDDEGSKSTSSYVRVDLADVDAELVLEAVATAKTLVENPESWYVIIDGPSTSLPDEIEQDPPTVTAHASNEYSESGYVELTFDGEEIRRVEPQVP